MATISNEPPQTPGDTRGHQTPDAYRVDQYNALIAEESKRLDDTLAAIRADTAAGHLSTIEAADNRIRVMEAHLTRLLLLRDECLGG